MTRVRDRALATGSGEWEPCLSGCLSSPSTFSTPNCSICLRVSRSTPAVSDPPVALHPLPRDHQSRGVAAEVEQIAEASVLVLDYPTVELRLPSQYLLLRWRASRTYSRPSSRTAYFRCGPGPRLRHVDGFSPSNYECADSVTPCAHQRTSRLVPVLATARSARTGRLPRSP
jgi:hypothetical protein